MKNNSKEALYESIMKSVANAVKTKLNESGSNKRSLNESTSSFNIMKFINAYKDAEDQLSEIIDYIEEHITYADYDHFAIIDHDVVFFFEDNEGDEPTETYHVNIKNVANDTWKQSIIDDYLDGFDPEED